VKIWVDVEDASGNRYGDGPITTAAEWQSTRRLDAAGTFSFRMPAADPRSALLANKRIVRCWASDADGLREIGAGIIDRIIVQPQPNGASIIQVEGDDLLRELANRSVGYLRLYTDGFYTAGLRKLEEYTAAEDVETTLTLPATIDFNQGEPIRYLIVRYTSAFNEIRFTLSAGNTVVSTHFQAQYYNSADGTTTHWENLELTSNTTVSGSGDSTVPFAFSGVVQFDIPPDWVTRSDGQYAIRFFDVSTNLDAITISDVIVLASVPTAEGLQWIMNRAPANWTLDPTGELATAGDVYLSFNGESVLACLVTLAEQTGEHFVLSPSARRVKWLGTTQADSGLRAIQGTETTDETMLIASINETRDSYELVTRVYAYGGGEGSGRLTMDRATRTNAGYTLDSSGLYLESDSAVAQYGRIDRREDFPDIAPANTSTTQEINAANALYDRVYNLLRRKCTLQRAYDLSIVPSRYDVWPGQTIRVVYDEWVENYHAIAIDTDLWVLEARQVVSSAGAFVVDLTVATVDYWPDNDYRLVAGMLGKVEVARAADLPTNTYSSVGTGVPVHISVENGQVVSVRKIVPVADGTYPPDSDTQSIDTLIIESGIITGIYLRTFEPG
jgi:hypothetical protein